MPGFLVRIFKSEVDVLVGVGLWKSDFSQRTDACSTMCVSSVLDDYLNE